MYKVCRLYKVYKVDKVYEVLFPPPHPKASYPISVGFVGIYFQPWDLAILNMCRGGLFYLNKYSCIFSEKISEHCEASTLRCFIFILSICNYQPKVDTPVSRNMVGKTVGPMHKGGRASAAGGSDLFFNVWRQEGSYLTI